jgi:hypothetical protein
MGVITGPKMQFAGGRSFIIRIFPVVTDTNRAFASYISIAAFFYSPSRKLLVRLDRKAVRAQALWQHGWSARSSISVSC